MAYVAVGRPVPRVEGVDKVTGKTLFAADVTLPGTLWAKVLRSPLPHARIVAVDASAARRLPGVHVVLTGEDLPPLLVGRRLRDMPVLARDKVRFAGEPVAVVAAEDLEIAEEALGLIQVEYQELPGVFDPLEALKPEAPRVHDDPSRYEGAPPGRPDLPNLQSYTVWERGDLEQAFRQAGRIFEHTFRTPLTHHGYLEPHACTVWVHPQGQVEVWASTKAPYLLREFLVSQLGAPAEGTKVHILPVGGDFGGKDSMIDVPLCYLLSQRCRRPVKMVLTYSEELMASHHRHPTVITVRTGVKDDGTLCAMQVRAFFAGGAYAAFKINPQVTVLGARQAGSCYRIPAIRIEEYCVYTNHVSGTQARSPGAPQIVFAVESHLDLIAQELGLDPVEFRLKNLLEEGQPSPLGTFWSHIRARETLLKAVEASSWGRPKPRPYFGRGVAMYERPAATGKSSAAITIDSEGKVTLLTAVPDCGPGVYTILQQIVAETLGILPEQVKVRVGDTDALPYDAGVGGSKSTNCTGHAAHKAAQEVLARLKEVAARHWECRPDEVRQERGRFLGPRGEVLSLHEVAALAAPSSGEPFFHMSIFEPAQTTPLTSFCAQVAEVEVDPETGKVYLRRLVTVHDVGTVLNPLTHRGQIEGGVVQGMGLALMEETPLANGQVSALHLGDFKMPTARDIPDLTTVVLEEEVGPVPYRGKAIGEIPNVPTAAAIANAVHDAVGVRIFELPITAEKVFRALRRHEDGGANEERRP